MVMNSDGIFLLVDRPWEEVFPWLKSRLESADLQARKTFDLQIARTANPNCRCPTHGLQPCNCQMMVVLVYAEAETPVSLIVYGYETKTSVSLVNTPQQRAQPALEAAIRRALLPTKNPA